MTAGSPAITAGVYYFRRHPANRIELSRGRDLVVEPGPRSSPINFLAYPVLEVEGQPVWANVQISFVRKYILADRCPEMMTNTKAQ